MSTLRRCYDSIRRLNYRCELLSRSYRIGGVSIRSYEPVNTHQRVDEENLLERIASDIRDSDVIYDIGANVGTHSFVLARSADATIISFEPNPRVYQWLTANLRANKLSTQIQTLPVGLSDTDGVKEISLEHRQSTFSPNATRSDVATTLVPVYRLDTIVENKMITPDRVKIDVEGHSPAVIKGAKNMLRNQQPVLYIESHSNNQEILSLLDELEYDITQMDPFILATG